MGGREVGEPQHALPVVPIMDEAMKKIGVELQRRYQFAVRRLMDWKMIDALVRLEEREEEKEQERTRPTDER